MQKKNVTEFYFPNGLASGQVLTQVTSMLSNLRIQLSLSFSCQIWDHRFLLSV